MDTLKAAVSIVRSLVAVMPAKFWLVLFGLIVGIPTSLYGLHWAQFKFVKQASDCRNDPYYDIATSKAITPQQELDEIAKAGAKQNDCLKTVSPNKGSVEFLQEQRKRLEQGRP
ncbi:MAG: hypothetical protein ING54_14230 [Rhodocyclaceae bacterium]|jgi:hypothetical protein|nr:hypothetical protein [Rhodocyclaceae bacterium]MCA3054184.1 hypothetical protein [Rhodocyclaceae bacterium]